MQIVLYNTVSEVNKADKELTQVADVSGFSRDSIESIEPSFVFSKDLLDELKLCNYLYVPLWGKYYFKRGLTAVNQTIVLNTHEDVLNTFKAALRANTVTISRNENLSNSYMLDAGYQVLSYRNIVTKEFPAGFENDSIILMTVG